MKISNDNPLYFLTSVTHKRLPVFATESMARVAVEAFAEARKSAGIKIFGYVLMPDHYHLITDGNRKPSEVLRFINGISARRVIDHLKENELIPSLKKLRQKTKGRNYRYSLWMHHPNVMRITNEQTFFQKLNYIHQNPVKAGLVDHPDEFLFSSSRIWNRRNLDDEPLRIDLNELQWRKYRNQR